MQLRFKVVGECASGRCWYGCVKQKRCIPTPIRVNKAKKSKNYAKAACIVIGSLTFSGCSTLNNLSADHGVFQSASKSDVSMGAKVGAGSSSRTQHDVLSQQLSKADNAYLAEDWMQASSLYTKVIQTIPNDAYAWFRLGNSLTQLGQYAQAVAAYETSLSADNGQFKAWFNLSTTHLLNAKVVTLNALRTLGLNDPSRSTVERRLDILTALLK